MWVGKSNNFNPLPDGKYGELISTIIIVGIAVLYLLLAIYDA